MMSRARGTYSTVENWVLETAPGLPGAAGWVLLRLATQSNYKRQTMTIGQLLDSLPYKARSLEQACAHLVQEGHVLYASGEYVLRGACAELARPLRVAHASLAKQVPSDAGKTQIYSGITLHTKKEEEGIQKEGNTDIKTPLTPQGGEAQEPTAPGAVAEIDLAWESENQNSTTPNGIAACAAVTDLPDPHQGKTTPPAGSETNATNNKNVPRRAAARFDPLSLELPATMPAGEWERWVNHRQQIKKPLTEQAAVLSLKGFENAISNGWDVAEMIDDAILHRWATCAFEKHREPRSSTRVVKFTPQPPARPRTTEEANQRFAANMAANADAIKGIF